MYRASGGAEQLPGGGQPPAFGVPRLVAACARRAAEKDGDEGRQAPAQAQVKTSRSGSSPVKSSRLRSFLPAQSQASTRNGFFNSHRIAANGRIKIRIGILRRAMSWWRKSSRCMDWKCSAARSPTATSTRGKPPRFSLPSSALVEESLMPGRRQPSEDTDSDGDEDPHF